VIRFSDVSKFRISKKLHRYFPPVHPLRGRSFELAVGHLVSISLDPTPAAPAPAAAAPVPIPVAVQARVTFPCLFIQTEAKSFCYNARDWTLPLRSFPHPSDATAHNYVHQHPLHPLLGTSFHDSLLFGCWCCCCACRRSKLRAINHFVCPLHPFIQPERPKEQPQCRSNGLSRGRGGIWNRDGMGWDGNGLSSKRSMEQDQFLGGWGAGEREWRPGRWNIKLRRLLLSQLKMISRT